VLGIGLAFAVVGRNVATAPDARTGIADQTPSPQPPYIVQAGDSLDSIASVLGVGIEELRHWNRERYPGLQAGMSLTPGLALVTTGPPLPPGSTLPPRAAANPRIPEFDSTHFPARERVGVAFYEVRGSTPDDIWFWISSQGPHNDWLGGAAQAHVDADVIYDFHYENGLDGCEVVIDAPQPVTLTYEVVLPHWTPPQGVADGTVDWWIHTITETVVHEGTHISIYEGFSDRLNEAVLTGTCASVTRALEAIFLEADVANCEFDVSDYGAELGLTLESCLEG
jgi:predicted secreted Zn-dependent protease